MRIFVSILDYNGRENTVECLKSLEKVKKDDFDVSVLVIDNASKDRLTLPHFPGLNLELIRSENNLGFSGGHNKAIKYALGKGADYILILNNDTILEKNLLAELIKAAEEEKGAGIIAPKIYFAKGSEFHKDRYRDEERGRVLWFAGGDIDWKNVIGHHRGVDEVDSGHYEKREETGFASGACMLIKREVLEKTGFFDEKYFLYYEDNDLCIRAKRRDFKILYEPKAILWHKNASASGGSGSALQDYYIARNRMMFGLRYAPLRGKIALIRESIKILIMGRPWQKTGILDFYMGRFGKGSYG